MIEFRPRHELEQAADAVGRLPGVRAAVACYHDGLERTVVSITLADGFERVPPRVLRALAREDCGIRSVAERREPLRLEVIAV